MRAALARIAAAGLLVVALMPQAHAHDRPLPKTPRTAEDVYQVPAPALTPVHPYGLAVCNRGGAAGGNRGCAHFPVMLNERWVQVEITDATGLPTPGFISQGDNLDTWIPFCGSTEKPVRIVPGVELTVWAYAYRSPNLPTCAGTATTGTIKVTFTRTR